jgi:hypothetical protein
MVTLDQILYEAYCNKADWKSQCGHVDLPAWNKLPESVKECWGAVADAAIEWEHQAQMAEAANLDNES